MDGLVSPFPGEAELAPRPYVLVGPPGCFWMPDKFLVPGAGSLISEDAVELFEAEARERVVFIDQDSEGEGFVGDVEAAGSDHDFEWKMMLTPEHNVTFEGQDWTTHQGHIGYVGEERGLRGFSSFQRIGEADLRAGSVRSPTPTISSDRPSR